MSATAAAPAGRKFVHPDDLLRMWEEGRSFELVSLNRGVEFEVSKESSRVAGEVHFRLRLFAVDHPMWVFPEGTSYRCFPADPAWTRKADVSLIALDRMPPGEYEDEGHCTTVPDLVAEVVSPNDKAGEVAEKIAEWLAAGVKLVWEVYPDTRVVRAHRPDGTIGLFRRTDTLTAPDLLPGLAVPVADLFRLPGRPAPPPPGPVDNGHPAP